MHLQRATLYCSVQPFLKPWGFCYSIALIKRLHCQDAFVLQTLISQRSLAREACALLTVVLWINSAWNLYDQEACLLSSLSHSLVYFGKNVQAHSYLFKYLQCIFCASCVFVYLNVCMCLKAVLHPEGDYLKWRN